MTVRNLGFLVAAAVMTAVLVTAVPAAAQTLASAPPSSGSVPSSPAVTPWGDPDLNGIWTSQTITPLERPRELADKEFLTEEEAAEFERQQLQDRNQDRRDGPAVEDVARAYNDFW